MKPKIKQEFPPGWDEKKVRDLIDYYDNLSEDEWVKLIDTAPDAEETLMSVPTELVGPVTRLIKGHTQNKGSRKRKKKTVSINGRLKKSKTVGVKS